ncbi:hypothetical protein [Mucilaginibacter ginsenosidivorax]|uniref:Uncharacterized protein n=1 Tax=Mucilaginibacter ginsenosidivorax TaxID=862126 RepID=A0A5B8VTJ0_9SPHI|nr:hypothetical protein [Mucilaginibacter ginsenosidivorax]QEC74974.1 hypothetical protein FSB76_03055 [Mucilaginibacter ginsenosidivorax]
MLREKNGVVKDLKVLFVAAWYIFIAVSHIFLLPKLTEQGNRPASGHNSIFKRNSGNLTLNAVHWNFIQRTDKVVISDKKSVIDLLKAVVASFIVLLFALQIWRIRPHWQRFFRILLSDYRYSYLSFCSFRI